MKKLFFLFIFILAAIAVGLLIHQAPGIVMVTYQHWVMTTNIWVAFACLSISFFVFYFLIRLIKNICAIPAFFARRRDTADAEKYRKYLAQSIIAITTGDYRNAEKTILKAGMQYDTAYINYLIAAQAAHAQHAFDRRDDYLEKALSCGKNEAFAITLTQAQFFLQAEQWDDALLILKSLFKQAPQNKIILAALKTIYFKNHDWQSLQLLLPYLKKQALISSDELKLITTPESHG
ncbi:MAG: hypothetical protein A3E82_01850 [Gammaproteobacteria bacterium RIFCSPHIGHO2_12_FULL_38_11]|nr:MAG: hypothetical protein A3E82_01850 [Gammaproteobacteria bacterium RIFCSPHIGHO2_12_FULL_38_11]